MCTPCVHVFVYECRCVVCVYLCVYSCVHRRQHRLWLVCLCVHMFAYVHLCQVVSVVCVSGLLALCPPAPCWQCTAGPGGCAARCRSEVAGV
jgi:hypothetical protein